MALAEVLLKQTFMKIFKFLIVLCGGLILSQILKAEDGFTVINQGNNKLIFTLAPGSNGLQVAEVALSSKPIENIKDMRLDSNLEYKIRFVENLVKDIETSRAGIRRLPVESYKGRKEVIESIKYLARMFAVLLSQSQEVLRESPSISIKLNGGQNTLVNFYRDVLWEHSQVLLSPFVVPFKSGYLSAFSAARFDKKVKEAYWEELTSELPRFAHLERFSEKHRSLALMFMVRLATGEINFFDHTPLRENVLTCTAALSFDYIPPSLK